MNKMVYAIWLGDAWFTSASKECLQTTSNDLPVTTFDNESDAVATYNSAVNCGAVVHEEGNAIVRIKFERVQKMYTISDIQKKVYDQLMQMSVEDAVGCFLDYHGWQLITKSFAEHLVDEGYCDASDVGIEDTYEDDDGDENE